MTLDAGSELKLDGDMEVTNAYDSLYDGIWACIVPSVNLGKCILANGVIFKFKYNDKLFAVEGTLPGKWTATEPITGDAVGSVSWADGSTKAATWAPQSWHRNYAEVWDSKVSSLAAGKRAVTNKHGKRFALYLMQGAQRFSYNEAGYEHYSSICASAGLKMIISGYGRLL